MLCHVQLKALVFASVLSAVKMKSAWKGLQLGLKSDDVLIVYSILA